MRYMNSTCPLMPDSAIASLIHIPYETVGSTRQPQVYLDLTARDYSIRKGVLDLGQYHPALPNRQLGTKK